MTRALTRAALFVPFALACFTCAPPFDPEISMSVVTIDRLTLEASVGPVGDSYSIPDDEAVLLPVQTSAGIDTLRAFIRFDNSSSTGLWFAVSAAGGGITIYNQQTWWRSFGGEDPNYPVFLLQPLISGDSIGIVSLYSNLSSDQVDIQYFNADSTPPGLYSQAGYPVAVSFGASSTARVLGASFSSDPTHSYNPLVWLLEDSSGTCSEYESSMGSTSGFIATGTAVNPTFSLTSILQGSTKCLYYHVPGTSGVSNKSCISVFVNGGWQAWTWRFDSSGNLNATRLTGVTHRIDALLSTGELLSTEGGMGRVYDPSGNGTQLAAFPLGNLRFVYETFASGAPKVYFSQMLILGKVVSFRLYSIPTADLKTLSGG